MCQKLLAADEAGEPPLFGWVTSYNPSLKGALCRASSIEETHAHTFNVQFTCVAKFKVLEQWEEPVPNLSRAPKLYHGYLELEEALPFPPQGPRAVAAMQMDRESDTDSAIEAFVDDSEDDAFSITDFITRFPQVAGRFPAMAGQENVDDDSESSDLESSDFLEDEN